MKQNIILVAVLATLSMVNGVPLQLHKRAVVFGPCAKVSPTELTVTMDPDPPVAKGVETFTITGTPTSDLADGSNFVFTALTAGAPQGEAVKTPFCTAEGVTCPVATGTEFTAKQPVTMPETLPDQLQVELVDATGTTIGCSVGTIAPADGAPAEDPADGAPAEDPAGGDDGAPDEDPAGGDDGAGDDGAGDDGAGDDGAGDDGAGDDGAGDDDAPPA